MPPAEEQRESFSYRAHPHLSEINVWAWLEQLSRRQGRQITLGKVPQTDWDQLARRGLDLVWLMGVWRRSPESRRIFQSDATQFPAYDQALPGWDLSQVVGSPYAVQQYSPDLHIGDWNQLDRMRDQLHARNMGLILDFVPNHTALDHPWTRAHPEYYIQGTEDDFRRDEHAFCRVEPNSGPAAFIARGRDPYFAPWKDVAQLNLFEPAARSALLGELREIARHCDGVRCDMAMLVLNGVFARTWDRYLAGRRPPAQEFWTEAFAAVPNFVWLAEVYWGLEAQLQQLGFQFTYDKALYDRLRRGRPQEVRELLIAGLGYQSRLARFLENHDEARSAAVFGNERLPAVGTLAATLPGMRFYQQGQLEGNRIHLPIALGVAAEEPPDPQVVAFYEKILRITNEEVFHSGEWRLLDVTPAGDASFENLIAYEWRSPKSWKVVVVNLSTGAAQGRIHFADEISPSQQYIFADQLNDVSYPRRGDEIAAIGLYVRLEGFRVHLFDVSPAGPA